MAVGALLGNVSMLVYKRALVLHMTAGAKGLGGDAFDVFSVGRLVGVVAISAGHLMLGDRVMGKLGKLHFNLCMTAGAELFLLMAADFLLWSFV